MRKLTVAVVTAGVTLAGALSTSAAFADTGESAATVSASANKKIFCLYEDTNGKHGYRCFNELSRGKKHTWNLSDKKHPIYWMNTKRSVNNAASSMNNRTRCTVVLRDTNKKGSAKYTAKPKSVDLSFREGKVKFDDKASFVTMKC